jgi:hypothetical protein
MSKLKGMLKAAAVRVAPPEISIDLKVISNSSSLPDARRFKALIRPSIISETYGLTPLVG